MHPQNKYVTIYFLTMKNVAVLKKSDEQTSNLFNFVVNSNFHEFTTLPEMREVISKTYSNELDSMGSKERDIYVKKLMAYNFYKIENYDIKDNSRLYELMNNLSNFRDEVIIYIDKKYNVNRKCDF